MINPVSSITKEQVSQFASGIRGKIIFPTDHEYEERRRSITG